MNSSAKAVQDKLRALRESYARQLGERLAELDALWSPCVEEGDAVACESLNMLVHRLAGSGETFGFRDLSRGARAIEQLIAGARKSVTITFNENQSELLNALRVALRDSAQDADGDVASFGVAAPSLTRGGDKRQVYLLAEAMEDIGDLASELARFGYHAEIFQQLDSLLEAIAGHLPAGLIFDVRVLADGAPPALAATILRHKAVMVTLVVGDDGTLENRLAAVRIHASGFFTRPMDVAALVALLDRLVAPRDGDPYRVIVVDDDQALADYYAATLAETGMVVKSVNSAREVCELLEEFNPDLILLDLYMPTCSGMELAAIIRQHEQYLGIPIVYLSGERDLGKQLEAMRVGGDDFLTKPVTPTHLIEAVKIRVERSRMLRTFMTRDGLTGLYNHTRTKELLSKELNAAARRASRVVFAMLDLDHFKSVNDIYGHQTGDRVLKSLAELLRRRLRRTDIIGRFGGEEFAIAMPDTTLEQALEVLEQLRADYEAITHHANAMQFTSTFSCGVAVFPAYANVNALIEAADQALYRAKDAGRNRICVAQD